MTQMTAAELVAVRGALRARLAELERIKATCEHCVHFAFAPRCARFDAAPPDDFRRTEAACDEWRFDGVPF